MTVIRCVFCTKMIRLGVIKHNHLRCIRNENLRCDCGCWQSFIANSIKAQDSNEESQMKQRITGKFVHGKFTIGGRVMPKNPS